MIEMYNFLLQAVGLGSILGNATSSVTKYMAYLPEALLAAVVAAFVLVWWTRKKANAGPSIGGGGSLGGLGKTATGGGMAMSTNMMVVFSNVQRRVVGIRPFAVERKKDVSGNILEKRAVYLDTKASNPAGFNKLTNVFNMIGKMFGRKPEEQIPEDVEGILFTESLAVGSPNGGWLAAVTLEENAQIPIFPGVQTNAAHAEEMMIIHAQYDKRISRLKDAALSINQYAQSANAKMGGALGKGMMIFGIFVLVSVLVLFYALGQLGSIISNTGTMIAAAKAALP